MIIIKIIFLIILIFISLLISLLITNKETMTVRYNELFPKTNYTPDLCSIMYKNMNIGDIDNVERCTNVENIINKYYSTHKQKCCFNDTSSKNNCYSCSLQKNV